MAAPTVPPVGLLRVNTIELAHPLGQIALWRFDHQVVMVGHQTVGMAQPIRVLDNLAENLQKKLTVAVVS